MKKYEYVSVHVGKVLGSKCEEHRAIIDKYAALGFRYVGYVPTWVDEAGKLITIDLIFEVDYEMKK